MGNNHEYVKGIVNQEMLSLISRVSQLEQTATGSSGGSGLAGSTAVHHGGSARRAMEHKAITNIKMQGSDRSGYRMWHEKLVHAFA